LGFGGERPPNKINYYDKLFDSNLIENLTDLAGNSNSVTYFNKE